MRDERGDPHKKATSTVSRSGDGDVVLGEEPQFCAQVEQNDASQIYIDNGEMLTNLVNAYTSGATEQGAPAPAGGHELCPFCCEELSKNGLKEHLNNCDGDSIVRNFKCSHCGINLSTDEINAYRHLRKCQMS